MNSKSSTYILAKFDVSGIQQYIFASNRLRENVGASCQVTRILEEFLPEAIEESIILPQECIVKWEEEDRLSILERENIKAEIIYIGGGNAMVLFGGREIFQSVCRNLGRKTAENCQGIYLAVAYIESSLQNFRNDIDELTENMAKNKADMIRQPIYSSFPVVEQDNDSHQPITRCYRYKKENTGMQEGLPQVDNMTEMRYQKWMAYEWSREHKNRKLYPSIDGMINYDYPVEMDALCRKHGEDSYIAVVHIDGNGMGRQIHEVLHAYEEYAKAVPLLREKSKKISEIFADTYKSILLKLHEYTKPEVDDQEGRTVFPLRPIVLDGDDITFLCTADLAIPITVGFLRELFYGQEEGVQKITACAGIAFVHSHFPFYEAYRIAEESCSRAKNKWYQEMKENHRNKGKSFLDFQVVKNNNIGGSQGHEEWQMRPYSIDSDNKNKGCINDSVVHLYRVIKEMEDKWPSNRLHRIYRAILEGEEQIELLEKEFVSRNYNIKELIQTEEWKKSSLFDALELRGLCKVELLADFLNIQEK